MLKRSSLISLLCITLLTCVVAITLPRPAPAQLVPFLPKASEETSSNRAFDWLDTNNAYVCGKAWCANVYFPYFPYNFIDQAITIAKLPDNLDETQTTAQAVETRAEVIQSTMLGIFKNVRRATIAHQDYDWTDSAEDLILEVTQWLPDFQSSKHLHPQTPLIEVGTKNDQTVVFVPKQPDLGLASETVATVNRADALANGRSVEEVAKLWKELIRTNLSEALWGAEFDRRYPWARPAIIGIFILVTLLPILVVGGIRNLLRGFKRSMQIRLRDLEEEARSEKFASASKVAYVGDDEDGEEVIVNPPVATPQATTQDSPTAAAQTEQDQERITSVKSKSSARWYFLKRVQEWLSKRFGNTLQNLPELSVQRQAVLKQSLNLIEFFLRFFFWLRILVLFMGFSAIATVYPQTRVSALYFVSQAIIIPAIWMIVALADTLTAFLIDRYLNQWAEEGQLLHPGSNRYTLRVSTYSPALRGASALVYGVLGIYLTIVFMGIDTSVLAGAGAAALLIGFLSRNVLEDMLNGALILWTDRYAIGDVISIGSLGGFVEQMNLYTTQLRGSEGTLITVPNGQVKAVENKTKDWSRVDFKVEVAYDADARKALKIIEQVTQDMQTDPDWQESILEPAIILGVDQLSNAGSALQVWIKTQPARHWAVGRELRVRVKQAFDEADISLAVPKQEVIHREGDWSAHH